MNSICIKLAHLKNQGQAMMIRQLHKSVSLTITTILLTGNVQPFATPHSTRRALSTGVGAVFVSPASLTENATVSSPTSAISKATTSSKGTTKVIAQDHEFIKSDPDKRSYRAITLPNQLTALLVSDPTTDTEASSVHVRAGHFDDPPNRAGLAHFHEHMLFLGTEKYPREEEYEEFLGSNGGMSNAYTDMEDTNYHFNVAPLDHDGEEKQGGVSSALSGALDRFAQFFISPLFDESMLERELRAVDSEYLNGRTSDNWRSFQLLKHGSNKDHPFAKFGCGNYNTLTDGGVLKAKNLDDESVDTSDFGGGSSPREELVKFWTNKYHAGNIRLCVLGRASLDELQELVEKTFGPVRPPPAGFIPNGIIDQIKAGILKTTNDEGSHLRDQNGELIFQTEHMLYSPNVAFGPEQLGLIREVVPLVESRTIKIFSAVPPMDDPILSESRPFSVMSHLIGHESPGSLHHLLVEEGWINSLSSGVGISSSDFCLVNIAIGLTPKGMRERDQVLAKTWQWLSLIKDAVGSDDHGLIEQYHNELNRIGEIGFKFREMGDPTDFCSRAAEKLFDYEPPKLLLASSETKKYDAEVARAFLSRITPQNSLIVVTAPELEKEELEHSSASARDGSWETEERYGAKYRQVRITEELLSEWNRPTEIDTRLRLPALNEFIPEDLSLRCDDEEALKSFDPDVDYRKQHPDLIIDTPKLRMWHKLDRVFRVPKASIRLQLASPNVYRSPRSMTLSRIFEAVLREDLNSFVYDANVAGCNYRISCVPGSYRLSVSGYSEKLPHLLDVVTSRIETLIAEMKEGEEAHPSLARTFDKAKENLLRRSKNFVYDSPYETGSYNLKTLLETPVWHVNDYIQEMEGPDAEVDPLTLRECAEVAEECLFGRSKTVALCIGNINEKESREVADVIQRHFIRKRPLLDDEVTRFRALILPTKLEATKMFGSIASEKVPIIYEALAHSESEENNSVELMMQTSSNHDLGYEGLAVQELISTIAYNSAFNQLRTKEQLGYIVSAFGKKSAGGGNAFCVLVQSSSTLPPAIEDSCLKWVEQFRQELEDMSEERLLMETNAVRASLLEKDVKLSEEISSVWNEILTTIPHSHHFKNPVFDRRERFAEILTIGGNVDNATSCSSIKTVAELKQKVLEFYDKYFMPNSPERRVVSSRVYNRKSKDVFEANVGKPGYISSYDDARKFKQQLSSFPTAPYW